jgi:uncharacterized protein YdaU (DUF1376 family)
VHYFKFNIGDYHKKAGRLTMVEHGAYTLLLHACYDREQFPTEQEALDWAWARSPEEVAAVKFCLNKFFTLEDGRYVQSRIAEEIATYRDKSATNRAIAVEREARKRTKRVQDEQGRTPNQEPITTNQEPIKRNIKEKVVQPEGVSDQVWQDFLKVRKAKNAPLTLTALIGICREAEKAGVELEQALKACVEFNWQGFRADWWSNKAPKVEEVTGWK